MGNHHKIISVHGVSLHPKIFWANLWWELFYMEGPMIRSYQRGGENLMNYEYIFQQSEYCKSEIFPQS